MPSTSVERNYSKCPLKKRPVHFTFEEHNSSNDIKDEPENLCIKKENLLSLSSSSDEIDEKLPEINNSNISDVKTSVIVPTPTYPKLNLQPWTFHIPYTTTDFYRNIQHTTHHQQISPLRGDLHSPSSPSEGSLSPPPHFLQGRSSSVSPPIRAEIYRPIDIKHNTRVIKPEVIPQHRYMPYQLPYQPYGFGLSTHPPVSPSYSDSSYYSARSLTPESNASTPEDLSVKHTVPGFISSSSMSSSPLSSSPSSSSSTSSPTSQADHQRHHHHHHHHHHDHHHQDCSGDLKKGNENKEKVAPPRYQCPDCNKSYSTFSGLTKHQQFHCPAAEGNQIKKSFSCKDCDKTYVSLGALKMHIRTHTLPCKCTICGKAFSRPWLLQGHIRTHTGEKPFSCQHCHRAFADRSNLRAHLQTHSDVKKYSCSTCSKTFSRMSLLTKHTEGGCPGIQMTNNNNSSSYLPSYQEH